MPHTKIKYCCNLCFSEYESEGRAKMCEELGEPSDTSHINVGENLTFTREVPRQDVGDVLTYITSDGTVVGKELKYNPRTNLHHHLFIVQTTDERGEYEGLVAMLNVNGKNELFMALAPRYQIGFAETMRKTNEKQNGNN